jgi:superfamily II DNA or RNA helicase
MNHNLAERFVVERINPVGFGWCQRVDAGLATVRYFDLPGSVAQERRLPAQNLVAKDLPLEHRVWVRNKGFGWWPGRIKGKNADTSYFVKLAGVGPAVPVPAWSIQVRWDQPLASATDALAIGMTDSPEYYRARFEVVANLIEQRAACRGFTSILSAAVGLFHHQIDVVTRVLNDPVIRFVLADEVGLGKTIEAGLVVRQLFLDNPQSRIVVCTPRSLNSQWYGELAGKLRLGDQLAAGLLRVIDHDELGALEFESPDMLVVDEAHRIIERALADNFEMGRITNISKAVPSILLLTATPLRGNAETFLGLLHLIDSEAYALDKIDDFRARLELRHEQASAIELLAPGVPKGVIRGVLEEFATRYQTDSILQGLIHTAENAIDHGSPTDEVLASVANHMRETYRISRRVIRHRRNMAAADGFPVSGRQVEIVEIREQARESIDDFMDQWRNCLKAEHEKGEPAANLLARGVEAGLAGAVPLLVFIEQRLSELSSHNERTEVALLAQMRAFLGQQIDTCRYEAVVDCVKPSGMGQSEKTVVFTGFSRSASNVGEFLVEALGSGHVAVHLETMDSMEQNEAIRRFVQDPGCQVLVCDSSGEEGRNLQNADQIIHLDLPLSVNRLEQRIGRADRFNYSPQPGGVPSIVFAEPGSPWVSGHLRVLTDGMRVFEESVATLQRPLAEYELELKDQLLAKGPGAFSIDVIALRDGLDDERNQIDLLEELEATLTTREFTPAQIEDLTEFEAAWPDTARAFNRLTSDDGGIRLTMFNVRDTSGAFRYGVDLARKTIPQMSMHQQEQLVPLLSGVRTFDRMVALRSRNVGIARLGDPLVDWIDSYLRIDEGGRTRAVWRHVPDWPVPSAWFCFDFLLEFDERALKGFDQARRRRLRRRGDAYLPPRLERVWTDGMVEAPDHLLNSVLETSGDIRVSGVALRGPRWASALNLFPTWISLCRQAEERAREIVAGRHEVLDWQTSADTAARTEAARRVQVLKLWTDRLPPGPQQDHALQELEVEEALSAQVAVGISSPRSMLFAAGGVIIAGASLGN